MSEWKEYKLIDICLKITDGSHKSPKAQITGYPMFSVKDMKEYGFSYDDCKLISADDYAEMKSTGCVPEKDDILIAKDGSYLKQIFICRETKEEAILSSIAIFRPYKNKVYPKFLMYLLKSPQVYNYIKKNCVSGSAIPRIVLKSFKDVVISVPESIEEQKKISEQLFEIDSKIECNQKICANLEAQAHTLFKHLFIDFAPFKDGKFVETEFGMIPERLVYKRIGDMPHTLETGKHPAGGVKGIKSGVPSIGAENIKGLGCYDYSKTKFITEEFAASMKRGKINGYELLIYKDGGKPGYFIPNFAIFGEGYPYDEMYLNEHVFKLDFGNKGYSMFAYFFFKTKQIMSYLNAQGAKAAIPGINSKDIDAILMPSIENESVKNYCDEVEDVITHILILSKESARLATLRDTLLPKLMSGQIKL